MFKRNQKGFTLIELMIVIAIIGILAAIAIPQFAMYRMRGFNSSAQSDVRNLSTSQAALFSDWQVFGGTDTVLMDNPIVFNAYAGGVGVLLTGPTGDPAAPTNVPVLNVTAQGNDRGVQLPLGNNVMIMDTCDAAMASFVAVAKHIGGNSSYAVDGDVTAIYFDDFPSSNGTPLDAGWVPDSVAGADEFVGQPGPSGRNWAVR